MLIVVTGWMIMIVVLCLMLCLASGRREAAELRALGLRSHGEDSTRSVEQLSETSTPVSRQVAFSYPAVYAAPRSSPSRPGAF